MKIIRKISCAAVALVMCFCLAFAGAEGGQINVFDMYGRKITMDGPAVRIVALTAAECEILCALGCEDFLVGRGEYCNYPESILSVPVVQSGADTNIEEIVALDPQLVLMSDMAQSKEVVDMLEKNGIRVAVSNADDINGTYQLIGIIGKLTGKDSEAEAIVSGMKETFGKIAGEGEVTGKTVYFEVSPLQWGLWTAGNHTFMNEIANICGLRNAFEDVEGWAAISEEQVLERNPDYIVTISEYYGEGPTPVEEIAGRAGWENVAAVKNGCILNADSDAVSRPGPRLTEAASELSQFVQEKSK